MAVTVKVAVDPTDTFTLTGWAVITGATPGTAIGQGLVVQAGAVNAG